MPKFSAFTGSFQRFSSKPPPAQLIFEQMFRSYGGERNISGEFDSHVQAKIYANAMAMARAQMTLERAGSQFRPDRVLEQLPPMEREVGRVPYEDETIAERRAGVGALMKVSRGARKTNVEAVMQAAIGDDFVAYIPTPIANMVVHPADPTETGIYVAPGTEKTVVQILDSVLQIGTPVTIRYTTLFGSGLAVGMKVVFDMPNHARREAVAVEALSTVGGENFMTVTCEFPHTKGQNLVTGRVPTQYSSKRQNVFVLSAAAAISARALRVVHRLAGRVLRGPSTWSITDGSGPFRVGVGRIGVTTIGEL